jgi:hypothetical protein
MIIRDTEIKLSLLSCKITNVDIFILMKIEDNMDMQIHI